MQIKLARDGKTVEVEVQPSTKVGALQAALASLTGLRVGEQIIMCDKRPLDAAQPLSAYHLPQDEVGVARDVFLYCKSDLRPGASVPEPETLPRISVDELAPSSIRYEAHPLDSVRSPLLQALPNFERRFRGHLRRGQAFQAAATARLAAAEQLIAEMNVQGMAIDAARSNVEHHYHYIQDACADFMRRYRAQAAAHEEVLARFDRDMDALAAADLHPAARVGGATRLLDLLPEVKLREWAAECRRSHRQFADKVAELEGLLAGLRADVEALFMQAPSADVDQLAGQAADMQLHVEEQASIVAALGSDFERVQALVEEAVRALSARPGAGSVGPVDAAAVMDTMHESHDAQLLPRLAEGDAVLARFAEHCLECKNQMTREVVGQLRRISGQQSNIIRARSRLSVFRQVASRQAEAIAELLLPRRLPAAYRHCLAECLRRKAFTELYAGQAGELAEQMARLRAKEAAARDAFRSAVERYVPGPVLAGLGLTARPPHCVVSVPPADAGLAAVTPDDLRRAPPAQQVQLPAPFSSADTPSSASASPRAPSPRGARALQPPALALPPAPGASSASDATAAADAAEAAAAAVTPSPQSLQMENARLRAELAAQVALACLAEQERLGGDNAPPRQRAASRQGSSSLHADSGRGSGGSGGGASADLGARFQEALAAKDDVAQRLSHELSAARQQAAAYEVRIRALEAHLARSSGARSGAYSTAASTYASGAASASASAYISGAASAHISGGSPSASSHGSCAAASVSSPSGHLPIAGAPGDAAAPTPHPGEHSPAGSGSPRAPLDPAQRAASGVFLPPSADRPPLSPSLPPTSSPRALSAAAAMPPLSLEAAATSSAAPPAAGLAVAGADAAPAASPGAVSSDLPLADAGRTQSNIAAVGADVPAVLPSGGSTDDLLQAAPASAGSGSADLPPQAAALEAAAAGRTSGRKKMVVLSPSLTSLPDADVSAAASEASVSCASTAVHVSSLEPAVTSGFRITGFHVPSAEQVRVPERLAGSFGSGPTAASPQPTLLAAEGAPAAAAADETEDASMAAQPPAAAVDLGPLPLSPPRVDAPAAASASAAPAAAGITAALEAAAASSSLPAEQTAAAPPAAASSPPSAAAEPQPPPTAAAVAAAAEAVQEGIESAASVEFPDETGEAQAPADEGSTRGTDSAMSI